MHLRADLHKVKIRKSAAFQVSMPVHTLFSECEGEIVAVLETTKHLEDIDKIHKTGFFIESDTCYLTKSTHQLHLRSKL